MVGDGVNDWSGPRGGPPGLALGAGTDVAIVAADMILLRDDLEAVPDAIALARATCTTIRRNLAWAFCYNLLAISAGHVRPPQPPGRRGYHDPGLGKIWSPVGNRNLFGTSAASRSGHR